MADITVQIPAPTLTTGQYFKVRYRELPSGAWSVYMNKSNLAFTITGLSEGEYQLEFILVNADATECGAVYRTYTVITDYECITFNSQMVKVVGLYHIEVAYTLPGGFTNPACGWEIDWQPANGTASKIPYASLPTSGIIKIPTQNDGGVLRINAQLCNGRTKECHVNDIVAIPDPPCNSITNLVANITEELQPDGSFAYFLIVNFKQSSPPVTQLKLDYLQTLLGGLNGDQYTGNIQVSPTSTMLKKQLNPKMAYNQEQATYVLLVTDDCGTHAQIDLLLTRSGPEFPPIG